MENQTSERLRKLNGKIMHHWEGRALDEIDASVHQKSLALRNSLPIFLDHLATALSTSRDRSSARKKREQDATTEVSKTHGRERAGMAKYTLDQLIFEYHILREVIFDVLETESPLSAVEREVIICSIEQSVNDAATQFSETLREIQDRFMFTLAHDLRTPLTSAKLKSQLFLRKPKDLESASEVIKGVVDAMDRIDLMITDLLDAARIGAGERPSLHKVDCDLEVILGQLTAELNLIYGDRIHHEARGPIHGNWDAEGLRRVFENLVTNAARFSLAGSPITLGTKLGKSQVVISVHNLGNPIPVAEIEVLFEQFKRSQGAQGKQGWGLGLVIVKGITEAHGGTVSVESSAEAGTIFTITLPWEEPPIGEVRESQISL